MTHDQALTYAMNLCARHEIQAIELARDPKLAQSKDGLRDKANEAATAGLRLRELRDYLEALKSLKL